MFRYGKMMIVGVLLFSLILMLPSCSDNKGTGASVGGEIQVDKTKPDYVQPEKNGSRTQDKLGFQFEPPEKGETAAVLHTSVGDIKIRLFAESAPIAVRNFELLIQQGYYNGVLFHRVMQDFMIQTGDPEGTGMGGASAWGDSFGYEFNANLLHFKGALSMAHSSRPDSNGSQFFIVQAGPMTEEEYLTIGAQWGLDYTKYLEQTQALYLEYGGTPWLDGVVNSEGHTVFGQVFEGLEIVDKIARVQTDSEDRPLEDITIQSAELVEYNAD